MSEDSIPSLFGDNTDDDVDYNPAEDDANDSSTSFQEDQTDEVEEEVEPPAKRQKHPGKKKLRRTAEWKRQKSSTLRNMGKKYTDRKGKEHKERKLQAYDHECRYKCCENVNEEKRQEIFNEYWGLASWELQSSFLNSAITTGDPSRKKATAVRGKSLSSQYSLGGYRVCKEFFLKTLDVSNKRVTNIIAKKQGSGTGISPRDRRGRKSPTNKIDEEKCSLVKEHIAMFPRYSSHYSRQQAPHRRYLNSDLNLNKLYECYKIFCGEKGQVPVTLSYYRKTFNTCFNLSFHRPHTDTCNNCDKFKLAIDHGDEEAKHAATIAKEVHLRKAESAKKEMDKAKEEVKEDTSHRAVCFDLQKMLPSPVLTCTKVYYARQLWTYNFNVHDIGTDNAFMFLWHEGQASRGCEEIISCLMQYIKSLPTTVTHLTAFCDNCGGQNKSQLTVKFWLYVVNTTHIETVDIKFLLTGHSYNHCDRDFGKVENAKKHTKRGIFVPDDWVDIIAKTNKKFLVKKMNDSDFLTMEPINKYFVKAVKGIRNMQWLRFRKTSPWTLFHKCTFQEDMPFTEYSMVAKNIGRIPETFPSLVTKTNKKKIKSTKFKDLIGLLPFVPPVHHHFYRSLDYEGNPVVKTRQRIQKEQESTGEDQQSHVDEEGAVDKDNIYSSDSE